MDYRLNKQVSAIMECAKHEAKDMGNNYIGSEHLLLAILKDSSTSLSKILAKQGMYYFQLKEDLMVLFGLKDQNVEEIQITQIVEDILERGALVATKKKSKTMDVNSLILALLETSSCVATEILHRYDIDEDAILMQLETGTTSELDKVSELRNLNICGNNVDIVGRDDELAFMVSILSRKDKANPLLIGEAGVGKTALVEKLASLIQQKKITSLKDACIYELHLNSLVAGTKYRGDFEEKLQNIIKLLEKYPHAILFIDEIHQMIGAGKSEGSIDVSSVLKPYLARGVIKCIGATTIEEYEKYIEKDRALERRFQVVMIKEPKKEETIAMMKAKIKEYEEFHQVMMKEEMIEKIVMYCDYYMPGRKFPDKAIDVLDLACVRTKEKHQKLVNEEIVKEVIERLTNIPISSKNRVHALQEELQGSMVGQTEVINKLIGQLAWIEQGVVTNRPLGVWLFLGNVGVGKKTLLHKFNQIYFNQDEMIEIDLSLLEKNLEHNLTKLRRSPYSIVSITNLHMASMSVLQFLKTAIEKGYIERDMGKVDLRHSIVVMSGDFPLEKHHSYHFQEEFSSTHQINKILGKEFMNIFDEVFIFKDLDAQEKINVVKETLKKWNKTMEESAILEAIESTTTLEEATKKLKRKIVKV
ncbi:MAG: AAA family ATPase [Longicatena sp.]